MSLTESDILTALRDCNDPEIPLNIVDLGLVYRVSVAEDPDAPGAGIPGVPPRHRVEVDISLTSPNCPAHETITERIRNRLAGIPDLSDVVVQVVWEPAWSPERISAEGRHKLGIE